MRPPAGGSPPHQLVELRPGRPALIRPGELITSSLSAVSRWTVGATPAGPVHHLRLTPDVDVLDLAAGLCDRGHPASPNHVFLGQPLLFGGPGSLPAPAAAVPYEREEPWGVTVGVLDTGLAPHPWLSEWYQDEIAETPDSDGDGILDEQAGHGTFVAGLILREAPGARLRVLRVLDSHGVSDQATLLRALARLGGERIDVLNLSFGGYTVDDEPPLGLTEALRAFPAVVACAGNTSSSRPFWPAALPEVVAVGALHEEAPAAFSARGPWIDACAQGVELTSSFLEHASFQGYATWSGTSFAAAIVSGAVARLCREMPPARAARHVLMEGKRVPGLGVAVRLRQKESARTRGRRPDRSGETHRQAAPRPLG
ncbi:S8/S53 family peptidase [Microtetraspora sp. NBRC 16547]|uniref:S8 family peptidase n=1 Tax=Microtetraspora sp. NBRC 16547 TaxID=3030993 RepID=UPI0024A1130B|nr:S8/S53 family peptidase [Microtetraspora sp. NBRC 16547]GLX00815.1 serine protease [Microtetraspora sp. NBRC 16547]